MIALITLTHGGGSRPAQAPASGVASAVSNGLYQKPVSCGKLTAAPFRFEPQSSPFSDNGDTTSVCEGTVGNGGAGAQRIIVAMSVFSGSDAVAHAVASSAQGAVLDGDLDRVDGTGFENAPFVGYVGDYGPDCKVEYRRRNEFVQIDFPDLPDGTDVASCTHLVMAYAKQLYTLIG